jgi:hypothetical protein
MGKSIPGKAAVRSTKARNLGANPTERHAKPLCEPPVGASLLAKTPAQPTQMPNGVLHQKATHPPGPNNTHQPPQYPVGAGLPAITPAQPTSLLKLATTPQPPPPPARVSPKPVFNAKSKLPHHQTGSVRHSIRAFLLTNHEDCPYQLPVGASMLAKNPRQPPRRQNAQAPATKPIPTNVMPDV